MKAAPILLLQFLLLGSAAPFAYPQSSVRYERELKSSSLSGKVYLKNAPGEGLSGILVEECSSDWKTVNQATHTNEKGHFVFASHPDHGLHHIRISAYGYQRSYFDVRITTWTTNRELLLPISVAN